VAYFDCAEARIKNRLIIKRDDPQAAWVTSNILAEIFLQFIFQTVLEILGYRAISCTRPMQLNSGRNTLVEKRKLLPFNEI